MKTKIQKVGPLHDCPSCKCEGEYGECVHQMSPKCEGVYKIADTPTHFYARCNACEHEHKNWREKFTSTDSVQGEWSRHANSEKEAFAKDILQPTKKDGTINKHFVEAHGTKSLEKEMKVSRKEIMDNVERYG